MYIYSKTVVSESSYVQLICCNIKQGNSEFNHLYTCTCTCIYYLHACVTYAFFMYMYAWFGLCNEYNIHVMPFSEYVDSN